MWSSPKGSKVEKDSSARRTPRRPCWSGSAPPQSPATRAYEAKQAELKAIAEARRQREDERAA